jgi:hypothetical protein
LHSATKLFTARLSMNAIVLVLRSARITTSKGALADTLATDDPWIYTERQLLKKTSLELSVLGVAFLAGRRLPFL